jgi:hypothetical protein
MKITDYNKFLNFILLAIGSFVIGKALNNFQIAFGIFLCLFAFKE